MTLLCIKRQINLSHTYCDSLSYMLRSVSKITRSNLMRSYRKVYNLPVVLSLSKEGLVLEKTQMSYLNSTKDELISVDSYLKHNSTDADTKTKPSYCPIFISVIYICLNYAVSVVFKSLGYLIKMYENIRVLLARIAINNSPTENIKTIHYSTNKVYSLPLIYLNYIDFKICTALLSSYKGIKNSLKIVRKNFDYKNILFAMSFI